MESKLTETNDKREKVRQGGAGRQKIIATDADANEHRLLINFSTIPRWPDIEQGQTLYLTSTAKWILAEVVEVKGNRQSKVPTRAVTHYWLLEEKVARMWLRDHRYRIASGATVATIMYAQRCRVVMIEKGIEKGGAEVDYSPKYRALFERM